jgi:hypothetical protein
MSKKSIPLPRGSFRTRVPKRLRCEICRWTKSILSTITFSMLFVTKSIATLFHQTCSFRGLVVPKVMVDSGCNTILLPLEREGMIEDLTGKTHDWSIWSSNGLEVFLPCFPSIPSSKYLCPSYLVANPSWSLLCDSTSITMTFRAW